MSMKSQAQENPFSLGATFEFSVESPSYALNYGIQGKYDFTNKSAIQGQIGFGKYETFFVGADYLYTVLPLKRMPSIFVGGGLGYEGIKGTNIKDIIISAQAGLQFDVRKLSPYVAFKPKFYFEAEGIDASVILFGVRYRI